MEGTKKHLSSNGGTIHTLNANYYYSLNIGHWQRDFTGGGFGFYSFGCFLNVYKQPNMGIY